MERLPVVFNRLPRAVTIYLPWTTPLTVNWIYGGRRSAVNWIDGRTAHPFTHFGDG
jgi:hypothetical protein